MDRVVGRDVTVVVPTRDRRAMLSQTLGSILAQDDVGVRVVVVDEGSSDGTPELLASLGELVDVVRHDEPRGLAGARNAGLERALTTWVAWCDDDDVWAPDRLASQLAALERVPGARWACTGTVSVDRDLRILGHHRPPPSGEVREQLRLRNVVPQGGSTLLVRTDLARELGGFDPWPTGCEDYDFHCRLSARSPLATVDRPLVGYRVWPGTMSTHVERMWTGHTRTLERHRGELPPGATREADLLSEQYWARFRLRNGDRVAALRSYASIAWRYRLPRQLGYALVGLLAPSTADRRQAAVERRAVPPDWVAGARSWLDALRPLDACTP